MSQPSRSKPALIPLACQRHYHNTLSKLPARHDRIDRYASGSIVTVPRPIKYPRQRALEFSIEGTVGPITSQSGRAIYSLKVQALKTMPCQIAPVTRR